MYGLWMVSCVGFWMMQQRVGRVIGYSVYSEQIVKFIEEMATLESEIDFYHEKLTRSFEVEKLLLLEKKRGYESEARLLSKKILHHQDQYQTVKENLSDRIALQKKTHDRNIELHRGDVLSDSDLEQSLQSLKVLEQQQASETDFLETRITDYQHQ